MSTPEIKNWLNAGIAALKAGNREDARKLLMQVLDVDNRHEKAWLLLSGAVTSKHERQICLENVLAINPANQIARKGLIKLGVDPELKQKGSESALDLFDDGGDTAVPPPSSDNTTVRREYKPLSPAASILYPERQVKEWEWNDPTTTQTTNEIGYISNSNYDDIWAQDTDICAYCATPLDSDNKRCPNCRRNLITKQFRHPKPSTSLHTYWVLLAGLANISLLQLIYNIIVGNMLTAVWNGILIAIFSILAVGVYFRQSWAFILSLLLLISILISSIVQFLLPPLMLGQLLPTLDPTITRFLGGMVNRFSTGLKGFQLLAVAMALFYGFVRVAPDFDRLEKRLAAYASSRISDAGEHHSLAKQAAKVGMWATAVLHWQRAAANAPAQLTYQQHLANAYVKLGFYQRGLDILQMAHQRVGHPDKKAELETMIQSIQQHMTAVQNKS
ncbi:MAG: hypothetical protein GY943_09285 [Chloroflexi bacterium]|nr:hypothetical protein [Chloroflexota bacterium]